MTKLAPRAIQGTLLGASLLAGALIASRASAEEGAEAFAAPENADAAQLLEFMKRLAKPGHDFESREAAERYSRQAAKGIIDSAERLLEGASEDQQKVVAVEMKLRSLRLLEGLEDPSARGGARLYLKELRQSQVPALAFAGLRLQVSDRLSQWRTLPASDKSATLQALADAVEESDPSVEQVRLLTMVADVLGDTRERKRVLAVIEPMLPRLEAVAEASEEGAQKVAALEGVLRRLQLPGNPIEVEGDLLTGGPVDWASYRGKVVLIDYWATWCGPCNAELPNVRRLHEKYADRGFTVLGVSVDDDKQRVKQFLDRHSVDWPTLFGHRENARGWKHPMVDKYGVFDLPRAILVDRDGHVVSMNARGARLTAELEKLFGDSVAADAVRATPAFDGPVESAVFLDTRR